MSNTESVKQINPIIQYRIISKVEVGSCDEHGCKIIHIFYDSNQCCVYLREKRFTHKKREVFVTATDEFLEKFGRIQVAVNKLKELRILKKVLFFCIVC